MVKNRRNFRFDIRLLPKRLLSRRFSQQVDDESAGNRTPKLVARISILRALDARLEDEASSRKELDPPKRGRR
ncbi:hypothetical protein V1478_002935 [Vespula squamosa]|uniref:Uncharacterized protein n=1 Tax=Vespula squamosa TaxID=30214 RepID=A0ABD2BRS1_VESSQ